MGNDELITYRKFNDHGLAMDLIGKLEKLGVEFSMEDNTGFDPSFSFSEGQKEYTIKIRPGDFEKVNDALQDMVKEEIHELEKDYPLLSFTDDELLEVVSKADEWSEVDYLLALKLLKERGKEMSEEKLEELRKQRIDQLSQPEKNSKGMIFMGYVFALLGGLIGILMGWHLVVHKKTLPNGQRIQGYVESDRRHGWRILILGIITLCIALAMRLNR